MEACVTTEEDLPLSISPSLAAIRLARDAEGRSIG